MDNLFKKLQEFFQNLFSGFNSGGSGGGGIGDFFKKLFGGDSTAQTAGTGGPSAQPAVQPTAAPNPATTKTTGADAKVEPSQPRPADPAAPAAAATATAQTQDATKPLPKTLDEAVPDKDGVRTFKAEGSDVATVVLPDTRPAEQPQPAVAAAASTDSILEQNRKAREAEQARNPQANLIGAQGVGTAAAPEVDKRNWLEKMRDRGQQRQDYYTEATMNPNNPYSPTNQVRSAIGGQVMGKMREMGDRGGWRGVVGDMGGAMVDGIGRSSQYREQTEYMRRNTAARSGYPTRDDGVIMCGGDVNARVPNASGQFGVSCGTNEDRIIAARERGAQRLDEQTTNNVITAGSRAVVDMLPQSGNAGGWFGKIIGR